MSHLHTAATGAAIMLLSFMHSLAPVVAAAPTGPLDRIKGRRDWTLANLDVGVQIAKNLLPGDPSGGGLVAGGFGVKWPADAGTVAAQGFGFDLCILAAANRDPPVLSATLESVFPPPSDPSTCPSLLPRRTLLLFDKAPQGFDPMQLVPEHARGLDIKVQVIGDVTDPNAHAVGDPFRDYLRLPDGVMSQNQSDIFKTIYPDYTMKLAECFAWAEGTQRPLLITEDDIWMAVGYGKFLAEADRSLRAALDPTGLSKDSPPSFLNLYNPTFLGKYPENGFAALAQGLRDDAAATRAAVDAAAGTSAAAARDPQGYGGALCSASDLLWQGWSGARAQALFFSNDAFKSQLRACLLEACFSKAFCADLGYQQCLGNPLLSSKYPAIEEAAVRSFRFSLTQHTGIKTTVWHSGLIGPWQWHQALDFADSSRLVGLNPCFRRLQLQRPTCDGPASGFFVAPLGTASLPAEAQAQQQQQQQQQQQPGGVEGSSSDGGASQAKAQAQSLFVDLEMVAEGPAGVPGAAGAV